MRPANAIGSDGARYQSRNGSADRQRADKDRIAMYVAAPLSGNAVAERETEKASADETCGE